jgi:ribonuclease R
MTNKKKSSSQKSGSNRHKKKSGQPNQAEQLMKHEIMIYLSRNKTQAFSVKQIAAATTLWSKSNNNKLRSLLDRLAAEGKVEYLDKGKYQYLSADRVQTAVGKLQVARSGVGFVLQDESDDIFVGPGAMGKAMNGDLVKVKLLRQRKRNGKPEGEVIEVVQRARTQFVGVVEESLPGTFFLLPDDPKLKIDFYISQKNLNGAKDGQKVFARLLNWDGRSPEVAVEQVLGNVGDHNTEMHAILLQYGFDPNFPAEVEAEAANIPETIPADEIESRRDFRPITTFTIDPHDAKDFDDALSFRKLENGRCEVGIHIADVSYYVRPDSPIDREAFQRATSVYLVDRTVPMLPEKLSNEMCSLRPNEDKLTYSAVFEMDESGEVFHEWIGRTVIHSDHRFTYEDAQEVIDGTREGPFQEELRTLGTIAKALQKTRFGKGSIEFDTDEVQFILDEHDHPVGVHRKIRRDSHKLIEDFMLLANRRVAAHVARMFTNPPLPFVYRVHDRPNPDKLSALQQFIKHFGYEVDFAETEHTSDRLNNLLQQVQGKPEQNVIETIAIRSMAKAVYTIKNIGHFGLGFPFYTHFTSPIRRYPDLLVHRLLTKYHDKVFRENPVVLEEQLKHSSDRERTAAEAERASVKYKQVEFLQDKIGTTFTGIISGVIEAGFFVELDENLCEGFVAVRTMDDDYYVYDEGNYCLIGKDTGRVLRLGDPVLIEIAETDMKRRTIDMLFVEKLEQKAVREKNKR